MPPITRYMNAIRVGFNRTDTAFHVNTVKNYFLTQTDYAEQMFDKVGTPVEDVTSVTWEIANDSNSLMLIKPVFDREDIIQTVQFKNPYTQVPSTVTLEVAYIVANVFIVENMCNTLHGLITYKNTKLTASEHEFLVCEVLDPMKAAMWTKTPKHLKSDLFDLVD